MASVMRIGMYLYTCLRAVTAFAAGPIPHITVRSSQTYCVARVMYGEARGLPPKAQFDVAFTIMNRARLNRKYFGGGTPCLVAFSGQYSGVKGNLTDRWHPKEAKVWRAIFKRAHQVLAGEVMPHGAMRRALYYLNPKIASRAGREWFARHLRPVGWGAAHVHRFYAER